MQPIEGSWVPAPTVATATWYEEDAGYGGRQSFTSREFAVWYDGGTELVPSKYVWHGVEISALAALGRRLAEWGQYPAPGTLLFPIGQSAQLAWGAAVEAGIIPQLPVYGGLIPEDPRTRKSGILHAARFGSPKFGEDYAVDLPDELRIAALRAYRAWIAEHWHKVPEDAIVGKVAPIQAPPIRITIGRDHPRRQIEARGVFRDPAYRPDLAMPGTASAVQVSSTRNGKWSTTTLDIRLSPEATLWTLESDREHRALVSSQGARFAWVSGTIRGFADLPPEFRPVFGAFFPDRVREWAEF